MTARAAKEVAVAALLLSAAAVAGGKSVTVGQTFPIAEPDVLDEIQQRAKATDWRAWMRRAPADYGAFHSASLPRAVHDDSHLFDPTYLLPDDIRDQFGNVLYPKGLPINVYTRIHVPGRYIVIGDRDEDFAWLRDVARPASGDKVLVAGGNALLIRQQRGVSVLALDQRFIERFGLHAVPAIVQQEGTQLRVREFYVAGLKPRLDTTTAPAPGAQSEPGRGP